jgi:hypothetical protein
MTPTRSRIFLLSLALTAAASAPALADGLSFRGIGPRVGLSVDPDQFVAGLQIDLGDIVKTLRFQPNFDIGIDEDATLLGAYLGAYWFFDADGSWDPYAGGDLGFVWEDADDRDSDLDVAFNAVGGIETRLKSNNRFLVELKIGLTSDPDFKLVVGWTF